MSCIGRPSKFTSERCAAIIKSISNYVPYEIAAEANGICEDTLYEWIKKGRQDIKANVDSEYALFSEAIKRTEEKKITQHANNIADKEDKWQADAWMLERRWWKHFSTSAPIIEFNKRLERLESNRREESNG